MKVDRLEDEETNGACLWLFKEVLFLWRFSADLKYGGLFLRRFICTKPDVIFTLSSHDEVIIHCQFCLSIRWYVKNVQNLQYVKTYEN
jgi:hypothetical protein